MNPTQCDPSRVAALLAGDMDANEQSLVEAHVETCVVCQKTLAESASEIGDWTAASRHLQDDEHDGGASAPIAPGAIEPRPKTQAEIEHAVEIRSTDSATAVVIRQIIGWLDPTDDPRMLGRIANYEIAGVIGSGGMGVVLKGFDPSLNRFVAIKLLAPHLAGNGASRQRFAREAQAAAAVVHENVIAIHSVSEFNDLPYLVMPYVRGMSLQKRIDVEGPLELEEILRIGMQTASGLAAAHAQGLVHRDIKPANILLADGVSRVSITDFGLARAADDASLTHSGLIAGTPQYMSPEQASGASVDHRSDLYSLGSLMYAMCVGRPPFRAESAYGILKRIAEETARPIQEVNPKVPVWLAKIISRLHERNPDNRFRTATDVEQLLSDCLAHVQQPTRMPLPQQITRWSRRREPTAGWKKAAIVASAVGVLGVGGWGLQLDHGWSAATHEPAVDGQVASDEKAIEAKDPAFESAIAQPPVAAFGDAEPISDLSDLTVDSIREDMVNLEINVSVMERAFAVEDEVSSPDQPFQFPNPVSPPQDSGFDADPSAFDVDFQELSNDR